MRKSRSRLCGFTLMELMVAMALAAILITAISRIVQASSSSYQLQQNLGAMQESARFAFSTMKREIAAAGFQPAPWSAATEFKAIGDLSLDALSASSDRVSVRRWSDRNCFGNSNPLLDETGAARFFLMESSFSASASGNLALTCRYGPDAGQLTTQINNLGLVKNAEAFQALYAEDSDADGNADRWVRAGQWNDKARVMAIRLAILIASPEPVTPVAAGLKAVLDINIDTPADGRIRRVYESTIMLEGRRT